jgi:two-component system phosphate regulon sensor histidine kinase PhoR
MTKKIRETYRFAVNSAIQITLFSTVVVGFLTYLFFEFSIVFCLIFAVSVALFSFLLLQYKVQYFIFQKVKKIYDDFSFLESTTIVNKSAITDMNSITREVSKFASDKKLEIKTLKIREEYRREFLGNISHELKTPLFTVQGYIETLLDSGLKDKTIRKKYLERALNGVERLVYIVEDLDTIAKLEMSDERITMAPFDIVPLIQNVMDLLEMKANKKDILMTFDDKYNKPILVYGNYDKIQQVVTNLIENSIKYGTIGGSTEVGIEDVINNRVLINISDNGEGIDAKNIPRLFERFFRVDKSGARSEGGSGLGLAIVKHIIEAHNEKIFVESTLGSGSKFSFTLQKTLDQIAK